MICILHPPQRLLRILAGEINKIFLYFNNANWQKANQLRTYKCDQGVALETTENKSS